MNPPTELLFDIETLINAAQPQSILLLGDVDPEFLDEYCAQKALIRQECEVHHITATNIDQLWGLQQRFDVGLALNLFEHIDKNIGQQVLSRLRDVLTPQYCVALPLLNAGAAANSNAWQLTDLFSFALSKVNTYQESGADNEDLALFKYNIEDYKKTPDWLNADNWANPQLWGKYWW